MFECYKSEGNCFDLNQHFDSRQMFSNELIISSMSLGLHSLQQPQDDSFQNQQNDFTFNHYIPHPSNIHDQEDIQVTLSCYKSQQQDYKLQNQDLIDHVENSSDNESELNVLKKHLTTIETIAVNEIQELKRQLQLERHQKQSLLRQIQTIKQLHSLITTPSSVHQNQITALLKQENKMLKEALKKQLHINKNLIRTSISDHSKPQTPQLQSQSEKENFSLNSNTQQNSQKDLVKSSLFDRPTIPHPTSQPKNICLRI